MLLRTGLLALVAAGASLMQTGCAKTMVSAGTDTGVVCRAFGPIGYSRHDTDETQRQTREHNAAWSTLCRK